MSEFTKSEWKKVSEGGAMETCHKLYTWVNHTVLMLLFQIFWKVSQISDYLKGRSVEKPKNELQLTFSPLTKEMKFKRHIRSMSDVQNSTPHRLSYRSRRGSNHILLTYDSDTRTRRTASRFLLTDSSDSSDYCESPKKLICLGQNIIKHSDSMRIL
ncbi:uncharacterized protein LOC114249274 [Bombyx mandarina]|uniref:Uncharacterized protein LOC114249274 n=1 Tax=Bombyx mandarina TaxID=7092 RepID=A0A6J2K8F0_BOMMA|nr:uncharacterized protein LOC114249274 [Bombyx mandarina]